MCFGVRDAVALALAQADARPLTILGDLVHNPTVLSALEAKGITVAQDVAAVRTPTVMVTAHGASDRTLAQTRASGLTVVEATCPLVRVAHGAAASLAREGRHVVVIGQRDHVEVRGLTGDLDRFDVVPEDDDVLALAEHPRLGVVAQTTQTVEKVRHLVDLIRRRFPHSDVRVVDTVCRPTKERQSAAVEMAREADVVIVVGGRSSNNNVFLRMISGWPRTMLDWDILFRLPLPWWGPVLAPVSIALIMVLWGTLATQSSDMETDASWTWAFGWSGIVLALAVFMIDAWRALPAGRDAVLQVLPTTFNWPVFSVALLLMAVPAVSSGRSPATMRREPADRYFDCRAARIRASMCWRYFSRARRPDVVSEKSVRGVRPANDLSHCR